MSTATDEQLMEAVQRHKLDHLNVLFERYQKRIYNYFLKSTGDTEESADLTQQVFIRILKYRQSYRSGQRFEMWIFQIARNQVKDHFRKLKVHKDQFTDMEALPDVGMSDEPDLQAERERKLQLAMGKLPADKRELLVLAKFQNMKYEDIATLRSATVSAIKVQVHRTIQQLRTYYFEQED